jgi:hypothetical protein
MSQCWLGCSPQMATSCSCLLAPRAGRVVHLRLLKDKNRRKFHGRTYCSGSVDRRLKGNEMKKVANTSHFLQCDVSLADSTCVRCGSSESDRMNSGVAGFENLDAYCTLRIAVPSLHATTSSFILRALSSRLYHIREGHLIASMRLYPERKMQRSPILDVQPEGVRICAVLAGDQYIRWIRLLDPPQPSDAHRWSYPRIFSSWG